MKTKEKKRKTTFKAFIYLNCEKYSSSQLIQSTIVTLDIIEFYLERSDRNIVFYMEKIMKMSTLLVLVNLIYVGISNGEDKNLSLDQRCDEKFLEAFSAQSECYIQGLARSCINLGLIAASGFGGGAKAYNFSKKLNEKLFKTFGEKYQAQLQQFAEFSSSKGILYRKAENDYNKIKAEELEKFQTKIYNQYAKAYGQNSILKPSKDELKKQFDAHIAQNNKEFTSGFRDRMISLLNAESNPFQKSHYQVLIDFGPDAAFEPNKSRISPFHKYRMDAFEKVFPEEMRTLRPFYDKIEVAFHNQRAAVLDTSNPKFKEELDKKFKIYEEVRQQLETQVEKSKNPRIKAFYAIDQSFLNDAKKLAPMGQLTNEQRKLLEESLNSKTNRATKMVRTSIGVGSGIVSSALMTFGVDLIGNALDKKLISKCQDKLKLSNEEVEFLSNGSLFSGAKVRGKSGSLNSECDELILEPGNLSAKLNEITTKFQGAPVGICNILISQQKKLMNSQESAVLNEMTCQSTSISNFETKGSAYAPEFTFNNGSGDVIGGKWDPTINWFDAESLVVLVNGSKDIFKTEKLRDDLKCSPNLTDVQFDKLSCPVKFILGCQGNQKISSCSFVNTANSFRIVNATRINNCTDLISDQKESDNKKLSPVKFK